MMLKQELQLKLRSECVQMRLAFGLHFGMRWDLQLLQSRTTSYLPTSNICQRKGIGSLSSSSATPKSTRVFPIEEAKDTPSNDSTYST